MNFGEKLKNVRLEKGYSILELGRMCNIKLSRLQAYENNIIIPRHATLTRITSVLHISWYYLLNTECTEPYLGYCTQSYADYIWSHYGKKYALKFQKISVTTEILFENRRINQKDRLCAYQCLFDSYLQGMK